MDLLHCMVVQDALKSLVNEWGKSDRLLPESKVLLKVGINNTDYNELYFLAMAQSFPRSMYAFLHQVLERDPVLV